MMGLIRCGKKRTSSLNDTERIVYQLIKGAKNKGIWIKDIKSKSGLHTQLVNSNVKSLEKKMLIKAVKSVKTPTRKVYMLYELEPSVELTGGAWYTDQELDVEFIDQLSNQLYKFILSKVILLFLKKDLWKKEECVLYE
jgi:DNA-directed RNA polymerase III subunit RPC6